MDETKKYETHRVTATVSDVRTVTLPEELFRELGIEPGDEIELEVGYGQAIMRPKGGTRVESLAGILRDVFPTWADAEKFLEEERSGWAEREEMLKEMGWYT